MKRRSPQLLPTLVALSSACGLAATPATALELGEIQVNSALGQPLRASIAYALNPNEQVYNYCIYLRPSGSANGAPSINNARISLTDSAILVTSQSAIREPILGMQIAVDCAYTPNLVREYTLFIDPEIPVTSARSVQSGTSSTERTTGTGPLPIAADTRSDIRQLTRNTIRQAQTTKTPIAANTTYRVRPGDSVSTIVSRVQGRTMKLWPAVEIVVAANPDAFVDQDMNRLIAGSNLFIPNLVDGVTTTRGVVATSADIEAGQQGSTDDMAGDFVESAGTGIIDVPSNTAAIAVPAVDVAPAALQNAIVPEDPSANITPIAELQPGDVIVAPFVTDAATTNDAITTSDRSAGSVPANNATPTRSVGTSGAWNWLLWLGGTGVALIAGLLLFGRNIKERFGSFGGRAEEIPGRRQGDDITQKTRIVSGVDFEFEDTINATAISLDADLGEGTGLDTAAEIDVAQDFGFSASGHVDNQLDMEITEEVAREPEDVPTDIIPPNHREEPVTIVESEELPDSDRTDEYDLSMIVDATKQPIGEYDATAKDLQAVRINDRDAERDEYTLSSAVDYHVLEQDYEDEFSATQALNAEIENAARELAGRLAGADSNQDNAEASVAAHDDRVTAELPEISDPDLTAELTANLPTTFEAQNDATAGDGSEVTVEMYAAGSDITVEMQVESGRIDTNKPDK